LIAAIRANIGQVAARVGKIALDERVLRAMAKVPEHLRVRATKNFAGSIRTATSFEPIVHVNINLLFQLFC